jgi:plastocyanin
MHPRHRLTRRSTAVGAFAAATTCFALLLAGSLAGCGGDDDSRGSDQAATRTPTQDDQTADPATGDPTGNTYDATGDPPDATIKIALKDVAFVPQYITALPGQTLEWTNHDDVSHRIKDVDQGDFASKTLAKGETYKYTFPTEGARGVQYRCTIHPEMGGRTDIADP